MTNVVSYVFPKNPKRQEGIPLYRVSVSDQKLTVCVKQMARTVKSRTIFEKLILQKTYKLEYNSSGIPYLKMLEKSGAKVLDKSLQATRSRIYWSSGIDQLIEGAIMGWFKKEHTIPAGFTYQEAEAMLAFPVLRDRVINEARIVREFIASLERLQKVSKSTIKAAREHNSLSGFIREICPHTVRSEEDESILFGKPELIPLASMNLGKTISELYTQYGEKLIHFASLLSADDGMLRFMFANLKDDERLTALNVIAHVNLRFGNSASSLYSTLHMGLGKVPLSQRNEIAKQILKILHAAFLPLTKEGYALSDAKGITDTIATMVSGDLELNIGKEMYPSFSSWYWSNVTKSNLKTDTSLQQVEEAFYGLFSDAFKFEDEFKSYTADDVTFFNFYRGRDAHTISDGLVNLLGSRTPKSKASPSRLLNGFLKEGKFVLITSVNSLDDALHVLEAGVAMVDKELERLGRELTSENRAAYIMMSKERKFKNTWKYYDLGVTDVDRILALKRAKVQKKADILVFNELPNEMFVELLELESGREIGN